MKFSRIYAYSNPGDVEIKKFEASEFFMENYDSGMSLIAEELSINAGNKNGTLRDIIGAGTGILIVSENFKKLFEQQMRDDIEFVEFLPINIKSVNIQYWVLNILQNIKCFDWENSTYIKFEPKPGKIIDIPRSISQLVIKEAAVGKRNIFRMYEQRVNIFISEKMEQFLIKNNITGYKLTRTMDLRQVFDSD